MLGGMCTFLGGIYTINNASVKVRGSVRYDVHNSGAGAYQIRIHGASGRPAYARETALVEMGSVSELQCLL